MTPPAFSSLAPSTTTTTSSTSAAASSSSSSKNNGDTGLSPAAVVGISIALHVVVTIILVLFVRAYRNKYKKLKKTQLLQPSTPIGPGGPAKRASPRALLKRLSNGSGAAGMTQEPNNNNNNNNSNDWIRLKDNVAPASDAWSSSGRPQNPRYSAPGRILSFPAPAVLSPTTTVAAPDRTTAANDNNNSNSHRVGPAARTAAQLPSYRTSDSTTYRFYSGGGGQDSEDEEAALSVWNDARWNEVLFRTLQEPLPRSQRASVSQVSQVSRTPSSYYGDEEEDDGNNVVLPPPSAAAAGSTQSLRQTDSRRRLVEHREEGAGEVIEIGHRPEDGVAGRGISNTYSKDRRKDGIGIGVRDEEWGRVLGNLGQPQQPQPQPPMVVRDAVPPPLRPSTRGSSRPTPPAAFQSHWSLSS
ncbi:hypothetical protein PG993_005634 [Apiospora rasikravindrae]|uniref:Uncharacterized protein n=1 Tax=Apiospora rasikravindrae TaxID=990691 RepID=A0ABR1TG45_9PEZI